MHSGNGITFEIAGSCSFNNDTAWNVITFGIDNSSSSHADNRENDFLVLSEVPTFGIMEALNHRRKRLAVILVKQVQDFAWVCIIMPIILICLLMEKGYLSLKLAIKILAFRLNFVLKVCLRYLVLLNLTEYLLNENVYDFSVDYNSIDKSDI